ncbi:MAG: metallophosphoesterase [Candidatus Micrarchaeota archaeon]
MTTNPFDLFGSPETPVRIVFISDIHAVYEPPGNMEKVVERINALEPDIVLLGGDLIEGSPNELPLLEPLSGIMAPHGTFAVLGNHDYGSWGCPADASVADETERALEGIGITVLRNENEILEVQGEKFALIGLDEYWVCRNDYATASAGVPDYMPKVVLAHNELAVGPDEIAGPSVILSGHTHCGQVNVPIITRLFFGPDFDGAVGGRAQIDDDTGLYVTCGITPGGIRFLAPPEISVIELQ